MVFKGIKSARQWDRCSNVGLGKLRGDWQPPTGSPNGPQVMNLPHTVFYTNASGCRGAPVAPRILSGAAMNIKERTCSAASSSRFRHSIM